MIKLILNQSVPIEFYRRCIQFLACLFLFSPLFCWADFLVGPEYEVKTGFIFNFANFITWPQEAFESSEDPISFCFISDHPAANVLFKLNGQSIRERQLRVQKVESELSSKNCQILFLGTNNKTVIRQSLAALRGQHVLTIGETEEFPKMGGIINFYDESDKLRFEVNIDAVHRANLKLGAQILQSAQKIIKETEEDRQTQKAEVEKLRRRLEQIREKERIEKERTLSPTSPADETTQEENSYDTEQNIQPENNEQQQDNIDSEPQDNIDSEPQDDIDSEPQDGIDSEPQDNIPQSHVPQDNKSLEKPSAEKQERKVGGQ
jgi:hypothetical protein